MTNVRHSANSLEVSKMLPSEGLQPKSHGGAISPRDPAAKGEVRATGSSKTKKEKESTNANKQFVWGPQTRTSIKKSKNP